MEAAIGCRVYRPLEKNRNDPEALEYSLCEYLPNSARSRASHVRPVLTIMASSTKTSSGWNSKKKESIPNEFPTGNRSLGKQCVLRRQNNLGQFIIALNYLVLFLFLLLLLFRADSLSVKKVALFSEQQSNIENCLYFNNQIIVIEKTKSSIAVDIFGTFIN